MAGTTLAYFDQMQGANYTMLSNTNFDLGIVDPDDSKLTNTQVASLEGAGKNLISYLSIGEAETYRAYWQSSWNSNPPSFLLGENPNWPGNYHVKFWDPAWQKIIIDKATSLAKAGYSGLMLDVVDVYGESDVANADGGVSKARADMMKFVSAISQATKAINPDFKIIQNNALDLLTTNPDDPSSATNTSYLSKIDGVLAESTYYNGNSATSWQAWNVKYLEHAVDAGKTVLVIDYPTNSTTQQSFITKAIADGFVPFVGTQALNSVPSVNYQIHDKLPVNAVASLYDDDHTSVGGGTSAGGTGGSTTLNSMTGTSASETINGTAGADLINGKGGTNTLNGNGGNDEIHGGVNKDILSGGAGNDDLWGGGSTNNRFIFNSGGGNDVIHDFQKPGATAGDTINVSHLIYTNRAQVMSHITYSGSDAVLHLDGSNTVTILGVGHNLTADDFHIA